MPRTFADTDARSWARRMAPDRIEAKNRTRVNRQLCEFDAAVRRAREMVAAMKPGDRPRALHVHIEPPKNAGDAPHVRVHEY